MRRPIGILALTLVTTITAAGCGGGSSAGTSAAGTSAAPAAAGAASAAPAAAASGGATDAAAGAAAAGGAAIPQITAMEADDGNDGPAATLPQGMTEAKAKAAGLGTDGAAVITVTGTDTSCIPDKTTIAAGKVWIKIVNNGTKITEMYLETPKADELIEVEKIKHGEAGAFSTTVKQGSYLIACEPGMADKQIRTPLTVTTGM